MHYDTVILYDTDWYCYLKVTQKSLLSPKFLFIEINLQNISEITEYMIYWTYTHDYPHADINSIGK